MGITNASFISDAGVKIERKIVRSLLGVIICVLTLTQYQALAASEEKVQALDDPYPIDGKVNLIRDVWGVPHIYAKTERDGLYGAGYALAEDNLENILFRYIVLNAKTSEMFGEKFSDTDWFVQAYNILEDSKRAYDNLEEPIKENYSAYIKGLKAYMRHHPEKLPEWWSDQIELEPHLVTAFLHWLNVIFSVSYGISECAVDGADLQLNDLKFVDNTVIDTRKAIAHASNQMGIMNRRTKGNVSYLVSDPHVTFTSMRSEIRIHAGDLNASGIVVAGYVAPMLGHTQHLAWAHTTGFPDVADCYVFRVDPENNANYIFEDEPKEFLKKEIEVQIRGGTSKIRKQLYVEKNGLTLPVYAIRNGNAYVPASGDLLRPGGQDRTSYLFGRAQTVDDALAALENGHLAQNIMAADTQGNLVYVRMGSTPIRPPGKFDWGVPVPGGLAATDWLGIHPVSDLVNARNPEAGYLQNNNISADKMTAAEDLPLSLRSENYPPYIFNGTQSNHARGIRAVEVMRSMEKVEFSDVLALATDEKWISASLWSEALSQAISHMPDWDDANQPAKLFAARIVEFDGFASRESIGALNLTAWLFSLGDDQYIAARIVDKVLKGAPLDAADYEYMLDALVVAEKNISSKFGGTEVRYGDVFKIGRGEVRWPIGGGKISIPGVWNEQTIRAYDFSPLAPDSNQRIAYRGGVHPQIMTLTMGGIVDSETAVAFGQSHDIASPHFSDQSRLLSDRDVKPSFFHFNDLKKNLESWKTLDVE